MRCGSRFVLAAIAAGLAVCGLSVMSWGLPATASSPPEGSDLGDLGHPRPDLTADELAGFAEGQRLFTQKPPGIGALFNDQAGSAWHSGRTLAGSGTVEHAAST